MTTLIDREQHRRILAVGGLLVTVGIGFAIWGYTDKRIRSGGKRYSASIEAEIKALERQSGLSVGVDAVLIGFNDGPRQPIGGYYEWVISSSSDIELPMMHYLGEAYTHNLPVAATVSRVERKLKGLRIVAPETARSSEWTRDRFTFRAVVVRGGGRTYLVVERFSK